ncbi:hypothetical protein [Streptomyces sp. NPDC006668]|uniref:hypothetical protein n=1 Tax=Streptomyces sp. NPDC006668 TaxID=3156903 RepID=UPI0033D8F9F4
MIVRKSVALAAAVIAFGGALAVGPAADAAVSNPARSATTTARASADAPQAPTAVQSMPPVSAATAAPCSTPISRFGHTGYRKCDADPLDADWDGNGTKDETFVIAANRTIWHTWQAAGGWKEMPNGGRADYMYNYCHQLGDRTVAVTVAGVGGYYSVFSDGKWHGWYRGTAC